MKFLDDLKEGTILKIENKEYAVIAMNFYVTETNSKDYYAKVLLSNHHCLCIDPNNSKTLDFGYELKPFAKKEKFPKTISFNGHKYIFVEKDYQMVLKHVLGDQLAMEGECLFTNHINIDDETETISMGYIPRTKTRADMYLKNIEFKKIKVIK